MSKKQRCRVVVTLGDNLWTGEWTDERGAKELTEMLYSEADELNRFQLVLADGSRLVLPAGAATRAAYVVEVEKVG